MIYPQTTFTSDVEFNTAKAGGKQQHMNLWDTTLKGWLFKGWFYFYTGCHHKIKVFESN